MSAKVDTESVGVVLHSASGPLTAAEIAKRLRSDRSTVNAVLYGGLGVKFRKTEDHRPLWSLLVDRAGDGNGDRFEFRARTETPIHVDLQGGDWKILIVEESRSRNDPAYRLEVVGIREARVYVNVTLLGTGSAAGESSASVSALVVAATALCNHVALERIGEDFERLRIEILMRDVLHAFGV